jgi:hypothetical protein
LWQNADFNIKPEGMHIYHYALKGREGKADKHVTLRCGLAAVCEFIPSSAFEFQSARAAHRLLQFMYRSIEIFGESSPIIVFPLRT